MTDMTILMLHKNVSRETFGISGRATIPFEAEIRLPFQPS